MSKCTFCGSDELFIETPFVELNDKGEHVPKKTPCCQAQRKNMQYIKRHFDPLAENIPTLEEVAKE